MKDRNDLIIFDPDATITHPIADLANTLLNTLVEVPDVGIQEAVEILKGYESVTKVDYKVLNAFFIIQCVRKIDRWQHKNRPKKVDKTKELLNDIPAFLRK